MKRICFFCSLFKVLAKGKVCEEQFHTKTEFCFTSFCIHCRRMGISGRKLQRIHSVRTLLDKHRIVNGFKQVHLSVCAMSAMSAMYTSINEDAVGSKFDRNTHAAHTYRATQTENTSAYWVFYLQIAIVMLKICYKNGKN